jgi:hypothetical protein
MKQKLLFELPDVIVSSCTVAGVGSSIVAAHTVSALSEAAGCARLFAFFATFSPDLPRKLQAQAG